MKATSRQTVFLVISTYAKVNFVLRTNLLNELRKKHLQVVILAPWGREEWFQKEFGGEGISFEPLHEGGRGTIALFLNQLRQEALKIDNPDLQVGLEILARAKRRFGATSDPGMRRVRMVLRALPLFLTRSEAFWRTLNRVGVWNKTYRKLFRTYRPYAVILDTPGPPEFLAYIERYNVPAALVDINIDALQARYPFRLPSVIKKITMLSEAMQEEAHRANDIPLSMLPIVGSIRNEHYFAHTFSDTTREEYMRSIGASPASKLIVYATVDPRLFPYNTDIVEALLDLIESGKIPNAHLLVSYGLGSDKAPYDELFRNRPHLTLKRVEDRLHKKEMLALVQSADVVVSVASTIAFEVAAVGAPVVWVGYDGADTFKDPKDSIAYLYEVQYLKRALATEGVRLAKSREELERLVIEYVHDRSRDRERRQKLLETLFYKLDGKAAERIAEVVTSL